MGEGASVWIVLFEKNKRTIEWSFTYINFLFISIEELNHPNISLLLDARTKPLATSTEATCYTVYLYTLLFRTAPQYFSFIASRTFVGRTALSHICLKLVIVMGITWIVDVLSWIIGGPDYVWYLTDLVNCLQGVFIFIVVGCQPQVWTAIKRMWCLNDSRRNGGPSYSSNATPSIINDQSSTKPAETLC